MPAYLCHGFRWHRAAIRIFVILQDLDDASPDWISGPTTSAAIVGALHDTYAFIPPRPSSGPAPESAEPNDDDDDDDNDEDNNTDEDNIPDATPSHIRLLEEYDPNQLALSRPYAYVTDRAIRVDLGASISAEMADYDGAVAALPADQRPMTSSAARSSSSSSDAAPGEETTTMAVKRGWFERLRDEMQPDEEIGWFVVSCGDEDRKWAEDQELPEPSDAVVDRLRPADRAVLDELLLHRTEKDRLEHTVSRGRGGGEVPGQP